MQFRQSQGPEQGRRELRWHVMLGIGRHRHVLLSTGEVLDSELMHSMVGQGLEQGQLELHQYVMLGVVK
eukprot:COSAG01_NODE_1119_length_11633_cov_4.612190_6_plen_69_part_00